MERKFGDAVTIEYVDVTADDARSVHEEAIAEIRDRGLIYPVTVVDRDVLYDGAVSYPAILRAVETRIWERAL
jgi:disulfide oxidoreductase YuzD